MHCPPLPQFTPEAKFEINWLEKYILGESLGQELHQMQNNQVLMTNKLI
jgi:hypothetical protein